MHISNGKYLFKEGMRNLWNNRTMTIASIGVLVACLLMTGLAALFSLNISDAMKTLESDNSVTVYLNDGLVTLESTMVGEHISNLENVESCVFVNKDEALQSMLDKLGDDGTVYSDLFSGMQGEDNFLPDSYKVSFRDLSKYKETVSLIKDIDGVNSVTDYSEIADKLTKLDKLVAKVSFWIVLILSIVSLFIISNTIRVTMYSRRIEISIMKSVGATNGFIRFPFVIEGIFIGLLSGVLSGLLLLVLYSVMMNSITSIVSFFTLVPLAKVAPIMFVIFIIAGCAFGALGGSISITKYLKREGGEIFAL